MMKGRGDRKVTRKLSATFLSTLISSTAICSWGLVTDDNIENNLAADFLFWTVIYFLFMGIIVLIYGNIVSVIVESFQRKWFEEADWLYILILGVFGAAIGLILPHWEVIIQGFFVAMLYGLIDKFMLKRWQQNKGTAMLFIVPLAVFVVLSVYFHYTLPTWSFEQ